MVMEKINRPKNGLLANTSKMKGLTMSDQQKAADEGGNGQSAVKQQPEPYRIPTEADINEMRERGDREGVRNAVEKLSKIASGEIPDPSGDAGANPDSNGGSSQAPSQQKKTFDIKFRGGDKSFEDDDGYLGAGDFGKMKKELAHNRAKLGDVEEQIAVGHRQLEETTQRYRSIAEQKEAAEVRAKELEARVRELESKQSSQTPSPQQQQASDSVEIPEPPARPNLPDDPFDWTPEQKAENIKYRQDRDKYDKAVTETMRKLIRGGVAPKQQPQPQQPAPAAAPKAQAEISPEIKETVEYVKGIKKQQESEAAQQNRKTYWDSFRDFQSKHDDFKTPFDIEVLNDKIVKWMDKLAYANGIDLKSGASETERSQYESAKRRLAYKYSQGDAQVIANSEGCPAPAGYDVYVRLANLDKIRRTITKQDVSASDGLHLAWLKQYSDSGMGDDIKRLEAEAASRGASGVMGALEKHQREHAVTLPNNLPGNPPAPNASKTVSQQEIEQLLSLSPIELAANPELANRRREVLAGIYEQSGMRPR